VDEMGWGFRTLLREIFILGFLVIGYVMNAALIILLTSLHVNIAYMSYCAPVVVSIHPRWSLSMLRLLFYVPLGLSSVITLLPDPSYSATLQA
jgi:hypothetical protein